MLSYPRVNTLRGRRDVSLALRVLSALVVWLAFGGHLGGLAHFALVSHHVCATHGELVHGDEHAHGLAASAPGPGSASFTAPTETDEEHDHCSLLARQKEQLAGSGETAVLLAPATPDAERCPRLDALAPGGEALLALAPKTSPPG
jgi:hypothetical protein